MQYKRVRTRYAECSAILALVRKSNCDFSNVAWGKTFWLQGCIFVAQIKRRLISSPALDRWNSLLQHYHITTDSYTWDNVCKNNAINARICPGRSQWYIGMTSVTLTSRELARKRKRNQDLLPSPCHFRSSHQMVVCHQKF